ncbi:MAG: ABC transporter ATP-binding protein [Lacunisphaera sp.]|nr:ABC transporter ATP-binding protein [Lacunisphaera sp.]
MTGFAKTYRPHWAGSRIHAIRDLNLRLAPGQVLGLLGPNGSGKSTTLKTLAGLMEPSAGECRVFGHPAGSDAAHALIGFLPELPQFSPHLTGREFLHYCAGLSSLAVEVTALRVDEVITWSGVASAAGLKLGTYSQGMRQRIGLAQTILHDPQVLLLDEPASGLDPAGRLALGRLIRDLAARGKIVLFSSHLLAQAEELCDRIAILGRGRLLTEGTPAELLGMSAPPQPSQLEKLYLERLGVHELNDTPRRMPRRYPWDLGSRPAGPASEPDKPRTESPKIPTGIGAGEKNGVQ